MNGLALTLLAAALASPPSGRPPVGPLERYEPRLWHVDFEVSISTLLQPNAALRRKMELENTPVVMPLVFNSTFSKLMADSLAANLWLSNRHDPGFHANSEIDDGYPFNTHLAVMPIRQFKGQNLRWSLGFDTQVWSSRIDETGAAALTWPREWPREVQDGLQPQMYIESDREIFAKAVETASAGKLRLVPPYLAAKDLIRYCVLNIQVSGDGVDRREFGFLHGMEVQGAARTAEIQRGSPHDLVCVCIAVLRAGGIPARPVVGIEERSSGKHRVTFVSWGEFYLEGAGWIPFDPNELRGNGIHFKDVRLPWDDLGTMKDLNRRIPLAFHFLAPANVQSPQRPAVWGWDPRPSGVPASDQFVTLKISSRGRVPEGEGSGGR